MEITKKARFTTDFYGGRPYLSGDKTVHNWLESQQDRLLHPRMKELKDAMGNDSKLEEILSVFNVNDKNEPVIGNWMLHQCSMKAQKLANTWGKFQVTGDAWKNSVQFTPQFVSLNNGTRVTKPDSVEVYQVSLPGPKARSFFKAYQTIKAGTEFQFAISFPEDLSTKIEGKGKEKQIVPDVDKSVECVEAVLEKMSIVGLGAYRLRFGKFEYV